MADFPLYPETGSHHDTPHPASERGEPSITFTALLDMLSHADDIDDAERTVRELRDAAVREQARRVPTPQGGQGVEEALGKMALAIASNTGVAEAESALIAAVRAEERETCWHEAANGWQKPFIDEVKRQARQGAADEFLEKMSQDPESAVAAQMARTQAFAEVRRVVEEMTDGGNGEAAYAFGDVLAALDTLEGK